MFGCRGKKVDGKKKKHFFFFCFILFSFGKNETLAQSGAVPKYEKILCLPNLVTSHRFSQQTNRALKYNNLGYFFQIFIFYFFLAIQLN